jgi:hypothetical protein
MIGERTFAVVVVSKDKPVGFSFAPAVNRTVHYRGDEVSLHLP